jgi:hypothetical protein
MTESPIFFNPLANVIGTSLIKYVNMYANSLNSYPIYDQDMQVPLKILIIIMNLNSIWTIKFEKKVSLRYCN